MTPLDILTAFILQIFSMFSQLVNYLITAPGDTFYQVMFNWGQSFKAYGILIPVVFVTVLGITGVLAYTLVVMSKDIEKSVNVTELIGAVE